VISFGLRGLPRQVQLVWYYGMCSEVYNNDLARFGLSQADFLAAIKQVNEVTYPHREEVAIAECEATTASRPSPAAAVFTGQQIGQISQDINRGMQRGAEREAAWRRAGQLLQAITVEGLEAAGDGAVLWGTEKRTHHSHGPENRISYSYWIMIYVPGFSAHQNMAMAMKMGLGT
jgi:hypothetical protein